MGFIKLIIGLPIFILLLLFAIVNNDFVTLKIWPTDIEIITSLSVVIFVLFILGYIIGRLFSWLSYAKICCCRRRNLCCIDDRKAGDGYDPCAFDVRQI